MAYVNISDFLGLTFTSIEGAHAHSDEIIFTADDGRSWRMYHEQDCCENVQVEEVIGDATDLIGTPITLAEESSAEQGEPAPDCPESWTWTFYKLATIKGYVTLRWLGESNGYYSESVDIRELGV